MGGFRFFYYCNKKSSYVKPGEKSWSQSNDKRQTSIKKVNTSFR